MLAGCSTGTSSPDQPDDPYNPGSPHGGNGSGSGSSASTSGSGGGSDGGGMQQPDMAMCPDANKWCAHTFSFAGGGTEKSIDVEGSWDNWQVPVHLTATGNNWSASVDIPYNTAVEYKFHVTYMNGTDAWVTDPASSVTVMDGNNTNSLLAAATCDPFKCETARQSGPVLQLAAQPTVTASGYSFVVDFFPDGAELDTTKTIIELNGATVAAGTVPYDATAHTFTVSVPSGVTAPDKIGYVFRVTDLNGKSATLFVPFWVEATTYEWQDAFIYEVMIDRFLHGGTSKAGPTGSPTNAAGDWKGGDFGGVTQKITDGYFDNMGVRTLWISSPILSTSLCEMGATGSANAPYCLSGYHSYFPIATGWVYGSESDPLFTSNGITQPIDPHFGTADDLHTLVNTAHKHGIRVLTDLVVNHVFADASPPLGQTGQRAPLFITHGTDNAWFNLPYNAGTNDCGLDNLWDTATSSTWNRTNCWFNPFLPDFNTTSATVNDAVVNHAVWLMEEFNLDGFRVDATKQVMNNICSDLRGKIAAAISTNLPFYMVGEALGSNPDFIMDCVGADKLDGSVNDPLHNTMVNTFLTGSENGNSLDGDVQYDESTWTGRYSGALMGHFFGSHDVPRAISIAAGNVGNQWSSAPPAQETNANAFKRLSLAHAFLLTYNPIPILWMGDEFGQPGSSDPDNRRMMRFGAALSTAETNTLTNFQKLGKARAAHSAFRRGARTRLWVDTTFYAYGRVDGSDIVVAAFNLDANNSRTQTFSVSNIGLTGTVTDALSGTTATVSSGNLTVTVPALTAVVFTK
jgi:glycosidase